MSHPVLTMVVPTLCTTEHRNFDKRPSIPRAAFLSLGPLGALPSEGVDILTKVPRRTPRWSMWRLPALTDRGSTPTCSIGTLPVWHSSPSWRRSWAFAAQAPVHPYRTFNNLTFAHAFTLPGVTMPAGTYVFESGPNEMNRNIVRVSSKNLQTVFYQGFTTSLGRPAGQKSVATFGEAARGAPLLVWYPIGTDQGHEFQYF